jgi:hypothetical protein
MKHSNALDSAAIFVLCFCCTEGTWDKGRNKRLLGEGERSIAFMCEIILKLKQIIF